MYLVKLPMEESNLLVYLKPSYFIDTLNLAKFCKHGFSANSDDAMFCIKT